MVTQIATIRIQVAWWLRWYLSSVALMSQLTDREPDMEKVGRWIERGVRARSL